MKKIKAFLIFFCVLITCTLSNVCFADSVTYFEDIGRYSVAVAGNNNGALSAEDTTTGTRLILDYPDNWDTIKANIPDDILSRINNMSGSYLEFDGTIVKSFLTTMVHGGGTDGSDNYSLDLLLIKPDGTYELFENSSRSTIQIDITDEGWYYVAILDCSANPQQSWAITSIYENDSLSLRYMKFLYTNASVSNGASAEVYYNNHFNLKDEFEIFGVIIAGGVNGVPVTGKTEDTFEAILSDGTYQQLYEDTYNGTTIFEGRTSTDFANNTYNTIRSHNISGGEMDVFDEVLGSDYFGGKEVVGYRITKVGTDTINLQLIGLAQEIYSPEMDITTTIADVNNDNVLEEGDTVHTTVTVTNVAADAEGIGYNSTITSTVDSVLSDVTNIVVTFNGATYTSATYDSTTNTVVLSGIDEISPDDVIVIDYDATINSTISTKGENGTKIAIDTTATVTTYPIDILALDEEEQKQYADLYLEETDADSINGIYKIATEVIVKYVDKYSNKELATQTTIEGYVDDSYTATAKTITDYILDGTQSSISGTMTENTITITFYYIKQSDLTVKYVDYYTGEEIATGSTATYSQGDAYSTEKLDIEDYTYYINTGNTSGIMGSEDIEVIYYYKKNSSVITKYVDKYTNEEIESRITQTGVQGNSYETYQKTITGYVYDNVDGDTSGTMAAETITVTYYYLKQSDVTVKYVDYYTGDVIATGSTTTYSQGDTYSTEELEIEGYTYYEDTKNTSGTVADKDIEVIYYYKKQSDLITEHIDANSGEKIIDDVITTYDEGDTYEALAQNLEGYILVESPEETTGTMGREDVTKTFYYKKISGGVVVKYVDEITNDLLDQEVYEGNENDIVSLIEKTFTGYTLTKRPSDIQVYMTVEAQVYTFYYRKVVDLNVIGIVQGTEEELWSTVQSGIEGNKYTTSAKSVTGYELVVTPENATGTYSRNSEDVVYEYKKVSNGVIVKYVDIDTKEVLAEETIEGYVGDEYKTEEKEFEYYDLVKVVGDETGTLGDEVKEVTYYYEKRKGEVVVIYEDKEGNIIYTETMTGRVEEEYSVEEKEIENYIIVEYPDNAEGEYIDGTIEVIYIVEKVKGTITVNFVDGEGNTIYESKVSTDYVGEDYYLEAPELDGYEIVENGVISVEYINGELVINVVYEKIEEVETGDINVLLLAIMLISSIVVLKKKFLREN